MVNPNALIASISFGLIVCEYPFIELRTIFISIHLWMEIKIVLKGIEKFFVTYYLKV